MSSSSPTPPPPPKDIERRKASGFRYWIDCQSRWRDNDQYGHLNNVVYYDVADAAINALLIAHCGMVPFREAKGPPADPKTDTIGLMISTSAIYYEQAAFPSLIRVGLRVVKLGSSSVLFELGMFELPEPSAGQGILQDRLGPPPSAELKPDSLASAVTRATHVYVDRLNRRPMRPMPDSIMKGLKAVYVEELAEDRDRGKL